MAEGVGVHHLPGSPAGRFTISTLCSLGHRMSWQRNASLGDYCESFYLLSNTHCGRRGMRPNNRRRLR